MSSVSLDVSGIDWEKWMDVFLEAGYLGGPSVVFRISGESGTKYNLYGNNYRNRIFAVSGDSGTPGTTSGYHRYPTRIAMRIESLADVAGCEGKYAICFWRREPEILVTWSNAIIVNTSGGSNVHGRDTHQTGYNITPLPLDSIDVLLDPDDSSSSAATLTLKSVRLIGMKRP